MTQYAIVAFPDLPQRAQIEAVRKRFDPMAQVLEAHVTIVFPFSSSLSRGNIEHHVRSRIDGVEPFDFDLSEPSPGEGGYIFLNVIRGAAAFRELHDRLYGGILSPFHSGTHTYAPHLTIGRVMNAEAAAQAVQDSAGMVPRKLRGAVGNLTLFRLERSGTGNIDATFPLALRRGA